MDFYSYWQQLDADSKRKFAKRAKTSVGYCHLIAGGHRRTGPEMARAFVKASDGSLTLSKLRPDIWDAA